MNNTPAKTTEETYQHDVTPVQAFTSTVLPVSPSETIQRLGRPQRRQSDNTDDARDVVDSHSETTGNISPIQQIVDVDKSH